MQGRPRPKSVGRRSSGTNGLPIPGKILLWPTLKTSSAFGMEVAGYVDRGAGGDLSLSLLGAPLF